MVNAYTDDKGVFKNKFDITDGEQLKAMEYELVARNAKLLLSGQVDIGIAAYDLGRLTAIHKYLFQDVYEWAGKLRTVPSSKRSNLGVISWFAEPDSITSLWHDLERECSVFADADNLNFSQKVDALADIFIAANHSHPYPEGNGRSLQVFMKQLANEQGVDLDYTQVQAQEWNVASAVSGKHGRLFEHSIPIHSEPDSAPIKCIFSKITKPIEIDQVGVTQQFNVEEQALLTHAKRNGYKQVEPAECASWAVKNVAGRAAIHQHYGTCENVVCVYASPQLVPGHEKVAQGHGGKEP